MFNNERGIDAFILLDIFFSLLNIANIIFGIVGLIIEYNYADSKFLIWVITYICVKSVSLLIMGCCTVCLKELSCCGCSKETDSEERDEQRTISKLIIKLFGIPFFISGIVILSLGFEHLLLYYHILIQVVLYVPSICIACVTIKDVRKHCCSCCRLIEVKDILRAF